MDVPGVSPSPRRPPTPICVRPRNRQPGTHGNAALLPLGELKAVNDDINVLALVKGSERYIFLFDDSQRAEALRTLGRYASNPDLSFTWYDAAVLSHKVRQTDPHSAYPNRITIPLPTDPDES